MVRLVHMHCIFKRCTTLAIFLVIGAACKAQNSNGLRLARIFSDNMVIQQGIYAPVWGYASGGEKISVEFAGHTAKCVASAEGRWQVLLPVLKKGGPYEMIIRGTQVLKLANVMVGEVWLASGQSNMEFTMARPVKNADSEIRAANYPQIREFHVTKNVSSHPLNDFESGDWKICTPLTVGHFSAVAYFFARKLAVEKHVAVGIINSSYGGTCAEAWTSEETLLESPAFATRIREMREKGEPWDQFEKNYAQNYKRADSLAVFSDNGQKAGVTLTSFHDDDWAAANFPLKSGPLHITGDVLIWYRKHFAVPQDLIAKNLVLVLGRVRQKAVFYLNGLEIGRCGEVDSLRLPIKPGMVKEGNNVLAVRLLSLYNYSLIGKPSGDPAIVSEDGTGSVAIGGKWLFNTSLEPQIPVVKSYANEPSALYNAMINPIIPYGIKGVIWYQGEANDKHPETYTGLMTSLINDWRTKWESPELPFFLVQLPNIGDAPTWTAMREAQQKILSLEKTGMAVTIDIGDPGDIHPNNKKPVGERLYEAAKAVSYGSDHHFEGPFIRKVKIDGVKVKLDVEEAIGGIRTVANRSPLGFELAGDDKIFYEGNAQVHGREIIVSSAKVSKPVAIRYAWKSNPAVNTYSAQGLPLAPFRSDDWTY